MTKLVCRLLDASDRLLGWCAHDAVMRGDGCLRSSDAVVVTADEDGAPLTLSVHWADMNVETRVTMPHGKATRGQSLTVYQANEPMILVGAPPSKRLPPVTTKGVRVPVPVGQLGAVGTR